ncbi:hypothetical protein ACFPT7_00690 [Acidicapsa dinghuensis]|uniref:Uncharacterized protein n=1 Tax=Acidicapsa dinghuensis TaxID=2218256 RepID=A0ABW1EC15_9BACT|nr:hypothetical protein [Acidicapsa dinghuensis]
MVAPIYVAPMAPLAVVERRVDALGVAWLVYAGLILLTGAVGLTIARHALEGHEVWGPHHWHGPFFPLFFLKFGWFAVLGRTALAAAAGWGLLQKYSWARYAAIVAACLSLIHPPLGTAIGIWTLVVLLKGENAVGYQAMAG